jgi:cytosine/adenosine deaminase-related metal-dependent hydrolase
MKEYVRCRVLIVAASQPVRRNAVVELDGDRVLGVRDETAGDRGPVFDLLLPGLIDAHSHARGVALSEHGVGGGPYLFGTWAAARSEADGSDPASSGRT